jgi:hypothetical protein
VVNEELYKGKTVNLSYRSVSRNGGHEHASSEDAVILEITSVGVLFKPLAKQQKGATMFVPWHGVIGISSLTDEAMRN